MLESQSDTVDLLFSLSQGVGPDGLDVSTLTDFIHDAVKVEHYG